MIGDRGKNLSWGIMINDNVFVTSEKRNYESTNPVFTCVCFDCDKKIQKMPYFILTKKDTLHHFDYMKTGFGFLCYE